MSGLHREPPLWSLRSLRGGSRKVCIFQWPQVCIFRWPLTMEHAFHFHGRRLRVRPALGMVEAFQEQDRSLLVTNTKLGTEISNPQIDGLLKGSLKRRCRIRAAGCSPR